MSATFNPALVTARDRMRLQLGDTGAPPTGYSSGAYEITKPDLLDSTYDSALAQNGTEIEATINLAQALIGRFAREAEKVTIGPDIFDYSGRTRSLQNLINRLRASQVSELGQTRRKMRSHQPCR
nr:hypothetical protein [Armatimonas sp.]